MVRSREVAESSINAISGEGAGNNEALSAKVDFQRSPNPMTAETTLTDRYGAGVDRAGARHTPGPWHACKDGACTCKAVWCADHPIADVTSGEWGDEYPAIRLDQEGIGAKAEAYMERLVYGSIDPAIAAANARLIAAAPDLLAAVATTRALISEAAATGFRWEDGDWADRLFANQRVLSAALAKATLPTPEPSHD